MLQIAKTGLLGAVMLALGVATPGQTKAPVDPTPLQAFMRAQLELSASELTDLTQGRPVVKTLSTDASREMITVGGIHIASADMARFVEEFKTLEGFKTSQFILQIQKFSEKPDLRDLDPLTLEAADIEAFRSCRVGSCNVQLSAEDIQLFNTKVDWKVPAATAQATALYKSILFAHLNAYRSAGVSQLTLYHDREPPMSLMGETSALLDAKPALFDRAAALRQHLRQYPALSSPDVRDFFYWSKESFGFKPVVGLNHVSVATEPTGDVLIVTTQIYASHYMDGSLSIHAMIPDPKGSQAGFYWLYANRARVGRLGGLLGTLARPIVQRKARAGLTKSFTQTKQRFEAGKPSATPPR